MLFCGLVEALPCAGLQPDFVTEQCWLLSSHLFTDVWRCFQYSVHSCSDRRQAWATTRTHAQVRDTPAVVSITEARALGRLSPLQIRAPHAQLGNSDVLNSCCACCTSSPWLADAGSCCFLFFVPRWHLGTLYVLPEWSTHARVQ